MKAGLARPSVRGITARVKPRMSIVKYWRDLPGEKIGLRARRRDADGCGSCAQTSRQNDPADRGYPERHAASREAGPPILSLSLARSGAANHRSARTAVSARGTRRYDLRW